MKLWIAMDNYNDVYGRGTLTLHLYKPALNNQGRWEDDTTYGFLCVLPENEFLELTFENSPQEVELTLCNHIDTVKIQDQNPKKQPCVMTNHGLVTDVIFK